MWHWSIDGGFNVWYDDNDYRAEKLDDVFTVKLFDGKTLPEIVDKITDHDTFTEDEWKVDEISSDIV